VSTIGKLNSISLQKCLYESCRTLKSDAYANQLSTEEMVQIQQSTSFSNGRMQNLAAFLNRFSPKGGGVEKNFQNNFANASRKLKDLFDGTRSVFECNGKSN
jgi:hypothetical protein